MRLRFLKHFILFSLFTGLFCLANAANIQWHTCKINKTFQCGSLSVPLDYKNPSQGSIKLPVAIHHASSTKLGSLYLNGGGPWGDDVANMQQLYARLSPAIQQHFDIITFTPRGVSPNAIACHSSNISQVHYLDKLLNFSDLTTSQGDAKAYALTSEKRSLCQYDDLYHYASTKNTVQDLEQFRQALGIKKLDYYGASYGTRLGLAYLLTYPQHINQMVLDGVVAPTNNLATFMNGIAPAIANTLNNGFFNFCQQAKNKCALYHSHGSDLKNVYTTLAQKAAKQGLPTSSQYANRPVTLPMFMSVITAAMPDTSSWPLLAQALNQAIDTNNADMIMAGYMQINGYDPITNTYKSYSDNAVFPAVVCKDYAIPASLNTESNWLASMTKLRKQYPLISEVSATHFAESCIHWPGKSDPLLPAKVKAITSTHPTVLLISNKYDPTTPYKWGKQMRDYLQALNVKTKLLVWDGAGHTAYHTNAPLNGCIENHVDAFIATGVVPNINQCTDKTNPFENNQFNTRVMDTLCQNSV